MKTLPLPREFQVTGLGKKSWHMLPRCVDLSKGSMLIFLKKLFVKEICGLKNPANSTWMSVGF